MNVNSSSVVVNIFDINIITYIYVCSYKCTARHGRHRFGVGYRSRLKSDVLSTGPALYRSQKAARFGANIKPEGKQLIPFLEG